MMTAEDYAFQVDKAYEQGINFGEKMFNTLKNEGLIAGEIDWSKSTSQDGLMKKFAADAAVQLQYANMAHLMLCGEIIRFGPSDTTLDAQSLAVSLAPYKMEDANIWGRYLGRIGADANINPQLKGYFGRLFEEDNVLPMFVGMETIGLPAESVLYSRLRDTGDALFKDIAGKMVSQKQHEQELVVSNLRPAIAELPHDDRERLAEQAHAYRQMVTDIVSPDDDSPEPPIDLSTLPKEIDSAIIAFHEDLGIRVKEE